MPSLVIRFSAATALWRGTVIWNQAIPSCGGRGSIPASYPAAGPPATCPCSEYGVTRIDGLAAVGVLAVRHLDDAIQIQAFGREVPTSGVALGAAGAGGLLAYGFGRSDVARGAAALAVGLGTGMLGREATRGWLAARAPAALSGDTG